MLISSGLSSHPDVVRPSWWVRNRRMQTSPKIVVLLSALLLLAITGILAPTSSNRTLMSSTSYCDELPAAMDVSHAIMMAYASLIGLLAWSLRGLPYDSFALRSELAYVSIACTLLTPAMIATYVLVSASFIRTVFPLTIFLQDISIMACICLIIHWPLYLSYRMAALLHRGPRVAPADSYTISMLPANTLPSLLATEDGANHFRQYLAQEFVVQNLAFLQAVDEFVLTASVADASGAVVASRALYLFNRYVAPGSPFQVTLPAAVVGRIRLSLGPLLTVKRTLRRADSGNSFVSAGASVGSGDGVHTSRNRSSREPGPLSSDDVRTAGPPRFVRVNTNERERQEHLRAQPIRRDVFEEAGHVVFNVLQDEVFPRFLKSSIYDDYCRSFRANALARQPPLSSSPAAPVRSKHRAERLAAAHAAAVAAQNAANNAAKHQHQHQHPHSINGGISGIVSSTNSAMSGSVAASTSAPHNSLVSDGHDQMPGTVAVTVAPPDVSAAIPARSPLSSPHGTGNGIISARGAPSNSSVPPSYSRMSSLSGGNVMGGGPSAITAPSTAAPTARLTLTVSPRGISSGHHHGYPSSPLEVLSPLDANPASPLSTFSPGTSRGIGTGSSVISSVAGSPPVRDFHRKKSLDRKKSVERQRRSLDRKVSVGARSPAHSQQPNFASL
jgi:hypothetical protein